MTVLHTSNLATLFSFIAALGVMPLFFNSPLVYTTINPNLKAEPVSLILPPNTENNLTFYIYNSSKITANDIIIRATFPQQIKVIGIDIPTWNGIINNGSGFEIHLDTDQSHNPVHSFMSSTFNVKIRADNDFPSPVAVIVDTMAKNADVVRHSFVIAADQKHISDKNLYKLFKKDHLPLVTTREKYFLVQKSLTIISLILGLIPFSLKIL